MNKSEWIYIMSLVIIDKSMSELSKSIFNSRLGLIKLEYSQSGLKRIDFINGNDPDKNVGQNSERFSKELLNIKEQIMSYLDGGLRKFNIDYDIKDATTFQKNVWKETLKIPFGRVSTYSEIAKKIGKANSQRAVGNALGTNPLPLIIPCHRVLKSDGGLGGYSCGLDIKRFLLRLEGCQFIER